MTRARKTFPTEDQECYRFVEWLEANGYVFTHLAQNTFTRSHAVKAKLKKMGVRKGFPDYAIQLKRGGVFFLEMKRIQGGRLEPEQKQWIQALLHDSVAGVALGHEAAIQAVKNCEKTP